MLKHNAFWEMNAAHHRELLSIAQQQRLLAQSRTHRPKTTGHIFFSIGKLLISLGTRLQARHEPAIH